MLDLLFQLEEFTDRCELRHHLRHKSARLFLLSLRAVQGWLTLTRHPRNKGTREPTTAPSHVGRRSAPLASETRTSEDVGLRHPRRAPAGGGRRSRRRRPNWDIYPKPRDKMWRSCCGKKVLAPPLSLRFVRFSLFGSNMSHKKTKTQAVRNNGM